MTDKLPQEYQQILNQIHSDIVLERLGNYVDPDGDVNAKDASDLTELARRLLEQDASTAIDIEDIQKLLEDGEIRDQLNQSIRNLINPQSKKES